MLSSQGGRRSERQSVMAWLSLSDGWLNMDAVVYIGFDDAAGDMVLCLATPLQPGAALATVGPQTIRVPATSDDATAIYRWMQTQAADPGGFNSQAPLHPMRSLADSGASTTLERTALTDAPEEPAQAVGLSTPDMPTAQGETEERSLAATDDLALTG